MSTELSQLSEYPITSRQFWHCNDVIMGAIASQITSLTIVYWTVYQDADKKKTSKLRVTWPYAGNLPVNLELPLQMTSNTENVSIWWRHHAAPSVCICREHLLPIQSLSQYSICDGLAHAHTCPIYFSVIFVTTTRNKIILDGRIYVFGIEWPSVITNLQHYWCRLARHINVLHPTPHRTPGTPLHALE